MTRRYRGKSVVAHAVADDFLFAPDEAEEFVLYELDGLGLVFGEAVIPRCLPALVLLRQSQEDRFDR